MALQPGFVLARTKNTRNARFKDIPQTQKTNKQKIISLYLIAENFAMK
jgi:hypothetical protein